jgi:hypothetical protein
MSVEARRACAKVRAALVHVARLPGEDPPRYLANCPPGDPEDDGAWGKRCSPHGRKDDPDFPKIMDRLSSE